MEYFTPSRVLFYIGGQNIMEISFKRLMSVEDAAIYLGLSPRTIRNGVAPKSKDPFPVKPKRIGKRVLFDVRDLDAYVDGLKDAG